MRYGVGYHIIDLFVIGDVQRYRVNLLPKFVDQIFQLTNIPGGCDYLISTF
ncbi:hypothetical protein D3C87_1806570 [compost metagenome]